MPRPAPEGVRGVALERLTLCRGLQTLMIRDWWMCTIVSVMFEFLEYSLEHQLPNFSECW